MEPRPVRVLVWIALAVPLVMAAVYLSLIRGQGASPPDVFTVPFVFAFMLLMAAALAVSLLVPLPAVVRAVLRAGAAGGMIVLGVLAAFSIGPPILLAGLAAIVAFGLSIPRSHVAFSLLAGGAVAAAAVVLLISGLTLAQRIIVCPSQGEMTGAGTLLLTGQAYRYQCVEGRLEWGTGG